MVSSSSRRALATARLDLRQVRRIRAHYGGTVNDVLLTVVTGALRRWLVGRGDPVEGLTLPWRHTAAGPPVAPRDTPRDGSNRRSDAELEENFPIPPLAAGQVLAVGLSWHWDWACIALHADRKGLPELHRLAEAIQPAVGALDP